MHRIIKKEELICPLQCVVSTAAYFSENRYSWGKFIPVFNKKFSIYTNALIMQNICSKYGSKDIFNFTVWILLLRKFGSAFSSYRESLKILLPESVKEITIPTLTSTNKNDQKILSYFREKLWVGKQLKSGEIFFSNFTGGILLWRSSEADVPM